MKPQGAQVTNLLREGRSLISPFLQANQAENTDLAKLFGGMKETKANPGLREVCENDPLIQEFAKSQLNRLGTEEEQRRSDLDNIRCKVRTVGRLLQKLNENCVAPMELLSFLNGRKFNDVVTASKSLALATDSPKLALNLGHYIKKCVLLKISMGIQQEVECWQKEGKDFQYLFDAHWTNNVSSVAEKRMRLRKLNKPVVLPLQEDMVALTQWVEQKITDCVKTVSPTRREWTFLAQLILVRIVSFNKRRIAEVEELTIEDFTNRRQKGDTADIAQFLDVSELALAQR